MSCSLFLWKKWKPFNTVKYKISPHHSQPAVLISSVNIHIKLEFVKSFLWFMRTRFWEEGVNPGWQLCMQAAQDHCWFLSSEALTLIPLQWDGWMVGLYKRWLWFVQSCLLCSSSRISRQAAIILGRYYLGCVFFLLGTFTIYLRKNLLVQNMMWFKNQ